MTTAPNRPVTSPRDIAAAIAPTPLEVAKSKSEHGIDRRGSLRLAADIAAAPDPLLARADAVRDTVEISPAAKAVRDMTWAEAHDTLRDVTTTYEMSLIDTWIPVTRKRAIKYRVVGSRPSGSTELADAATLRSAVDIFIQLTAPKVADVAPDVIDAQLGRTVPTAPTAPTDLGDGLGLEVPERFCEFTGPCGQETDHDRHNDDGAQRAAQERADADDTTP